MKIVRTLATPIVCMAIAALTFTSCNQAEVDKMKNDNEALKSEISSLKAESAEKDKTISEFFTSFNEIESNLATIKEKEKGLANANVSGEVKADTKEKIIGDIKAINALMEENKTKLSSLQGKLKKANINVKQMEEMMANLQKQIADQEVAINDLKAQLSNANAALSSLNDLYNESVAEGTAKEDELNTAYYVTGMYKELRDKNVVAKEGGVIGLGSTKQLKANFNKDVFQKVDIRQTSRVNTYAKEAKLLTTHPASSYSMTMENGVQVINIKDAKAFWAASKYLVIEQKKK
ncbi:MAG: hypothetical protein V4616_07595 [Bacteroidota bacterium]